MNVAECKKTAKNIVTKVLVLVLGNTFCLIIAAGIDNTFHKYCSHPSSRALETQFLARINIEVKDS